MNRPQLQRLASLYFGKKPWKHDFYANGVTEKYTEGVDYCRKCKQYHSINGHVPCPIPDPINIDDMGLAMKAIREACPDTRYIQLIAYSDHMMHKNWKIRGNTADPLLTLNWILFKATPTQIFEIAVRAMEGKT